MTKRTARFVVTYFVIKYASLFASIATFKNAVEDDSLALVLVSWLLIALSLEASHRYGKMAGKEEAKSVFIHYVDRIKTYYREQEKLPKQIHEDQGQYDFRKIASALTANSMEALSETFANQIELDNHE